MRKSMMIGACVCAIAFAGSFMTGAAVGQSKPQVTLADCPAEKAAVRAVTERVFDYGSHDGEEAIRHHIEGTNAEPPHSAKFWRDAARVAENASRETESAGGRFDRDKVMLIPRYQACLNRTMADRIDGGNSASMSASSATKSGLAPQSVDSCPDAKLLAINTEIGNIDARLSNFLANSPYAQQSNGPQYASPMLKVVMWATSAQMNAITSQCRDVESLNAYAVRLKASYDAAKKACDQIQSGGRVCQPAKPEDF